MFAFELFLLFLLGATEAREKIIVGQDVSIVDYPYQLFLFGSHVNCGASIISDSWVLTSASCLSSSPVTLRAGSSDRTSGGTLHSVTKTISHPLYNATTFENDIALLNVTPRFPIGNPGYKSVVLPWFEPLPGQILAMTGWGSTQFNSSTLSTTLRASDVMTTSKWICQGYFPDVKDMVASKKTCAAGSYPGYGDQGGPMVSRVGGEQHGVIPGQKGVKNGSPFIFTSIAFYRQWIYSNCGV